MSEQRPERPQRKNGRPPASNGGLRMGRGLFGWVLFIALAVMLIMLLNKGSTQFANVAFSDFWSHLNQDHVAKVILEGDKLTGEFTGPQNLGGQSGVVKFQTVLPAGAAGWEFLRDLLNAKGNARVEVENSQNLLINIVVPLIPWLLIFGFI